MMTTKRTQIWQIPRGSYDTDGDLARNPKIRKAAAIIKQGGLVAFPTETVYGLGADGLAEKAVASIFAAKGRPSDNPLILHIAELSVLDQLVGSVPQSAKHLMELFWPGPLTLVLPKLPAVPMITTGGLSSVAVRMPNHPIASALIKAAGTPLAAPSANTSGRPSPTRAEHVVSDLMGKIDVILDGGPTGLGVESTVLDCTGPTPKILRPGGVDKEALEDALGTCVQLSAELGKEIGSFPSHKYGHYAPNAPTAVVLGEPQGLFENLAAKAQELTCKGEQVGLMISRETMQYWQDQAVDFSHWQVVVMGSRTNLAEVGTAVYEGLRTLDAHHVTQILLESVPTQGLGFAIMNRLLKAADFWTVGE